MSLAPGSRLGAYEIVAAIGAGGMGEVYRARDSRLDRDVAIKILPDQFASDRERVARFEREAKTLATLNHSHIAQIYGFEQSHSTSALVMELVDGEDLSARIGRGPIPIEDALAIAKQIADALDAAHGQGIIHRDLKPGNIKIKDDGTVKVLDFGLAKAVQPGAGSGESGAEHALANSPTITSPAMTMRGVILGTAGYMAPEQAKGRPVDKRADIWAFGCIVYEMVTGQRAFHGDDVSETIAAVLKTEPDWSRVPASIKPLLGSCLQKDPRRRLRDIGDALLLLEPASSPSQPAARSSSRFAWSIAGAAAVAAIALAIMQFGASPAPMSRVEFDLGAPEGTNFGDSYLTVSPDGRRIAHTLRDSAGVVRLWVRDLDDRQSRPLQGTEGSRSPFWSPDSSSLAFVVGNQLHRIEVDGGAPRLVSEAPNDLGVGSWGRSGTIIVGSRQGGVIYRVAETGGPAVPVTRLDLKRMEGFHAMPMFLRDGKRFLYLRNSGDPKQQGLFAGSLDVAPEQQPLEMIVHTAANPGYFAPAAGPSWLVFVDNGNLMSQQLDESVPKLVGSPVLEAERIGSAGSYAFFSVSSTGVLAYRGGAAGGPTDAVMTWFDRSGRRQATALDRGAYSSVKLSPDGARIATSRNRTNLAGDIWLTDLTRGIDTRLTSDPAHDLFPIWSPDSSRLLFTSLRAGRGLYEKRVDGVEPERVILENQGPIVPNDWSPDGRFVLVSESPKLNASDLSVVQLEPAPTKTPVLHSPFNEGFAVFSPDGRYFAYVSDESGRDEVYVSTFTPPGVTSTAGAGKWRVSNDGGQRPRWRRDGKELFYRNGPRVMSVAIDTARPSFSPDKPVELFAVSGSLVNQWDVPADGQRFLIPLLPIGDASEPIRVTLNWRPGRQQAQ